MSSNLCVSEPKIIPLNNITAPKISKALVNYLWLTLVSLARYPVRITVKFDVRTVSANCVLS